MTGVRFIGVAVGLWIALFTVPVSELNAESTRPGTKYYDTTVPGLVRLRTTTDRTRYKVGESIVATNLLTNIGDSVFLADEGSLGEGFYIEHLDSTSSCGSIGDHAEGYRPKVAELARSATLVRTWDLSKDFCFKGAGRYEVGGSYCHYDGQSRAHGKDPALWCVRSQPVKLLVR